MDTNQTAMPKSGGLTAFDPSFMHLYLQLYHNLKDGKDITDELYKLSEIFKDGLDQLSAQIAQGNNELLSDFALAKRVVYEIYNQIIRTCDVSGKTADIVGHIIGRTSLFQLLPNDRFHITQDWFTHNITVWEKALDSFCGKPETKCLEIGSFEGLSACWLLENILTHNTSRIVCVDPFDSPGQLQAERNFDYNIKKTQAAYKVVKLKGLSQQVFPLLAGSLFDIIYIDGSHHPVNTLQDALSAWPLLKNGGVMIFDDYEIGSSYPPEISADIDPKPGIDTFLNFIGDEFTLLSCEWQMIIKKN